MEAAGSCEMSVRLSLHSPTPQKASVHGYHLENRIVCLAHMLVCVSLEDQLKVCTSVTVSCGLTVCILQLRIVCYYSQSVPKELIE